MKEALVSQVFYDGKGRSPFKVDAHSPGRWDVENRWQTEQEAHEGRAKWIAFLAEKQGYTIIEIAAEAPRIER